MLEDVKIQGVPEIKRLITITDLKKYKKNDILIAVIDTDNVDDMNEVADILRQLFKDTKYKGKIGVIFNDARMNEFVVDPNNRLIPKEKESV
jgi:hypothetical protein